jgi:hypothetical protein
MKRVNCIFIVFILILAVWGNISAEDPKNGEDYTTLFPPPLTGWEASEVTVSEHEGGMYCETDPFKLLFSDNIRLILTRIYRKANESNATVTMVIDTCDVFYNALIPSTPEKKKELEESGSSTKPFTYQSYDGIKEYKDKKLIEILLLIDYGRGFSISSENVEDENIIMEYLKSTDLQKIHAFMQQQ